MRVKVIFSAPLRAQFHVTKPQVALIEKEMDAMGIKLSELWGLDVFLANNLIPLASAQGLGTTVLDLCLGSLLAVYRQRYWGSLSGIWSAKFSSEASPDFKLS